MLLKMMIAAAFLLLLLLFIPSDAHRQHKISVIVYGAKSFEDTVHTVKNAFLEVFGSIEYQIGNTIIEPEFINAQELRTNNESTNQLEIASDLICRRVINGSISAVVYSASIRSEHTEFLSLVSTTAYSLGLYQVPTVAVAVRDAEFAKKLVYPTFIRPTPSFADEANVFLYLLQRLQYRQVAVLSVKGDRNAMEFMKEFRRKKKRFKIFVQSYIELELDESLNDTIAESFEEVTSNIIVMFATKNDAFRIIEAASDLRGKGKVWMVNEEAARAANVPNGFIAARLNQSPLSALRDSFSSIKHGIERLHTEGVLPDLVPPTECAGSRNDPDLWGSQQANLLYKRICSTVTAKISYTNSCERENVEYDVVNFYDGHREVGGLTNHHLQLLEDRIYWPGNSPKPLEISLPKHLRVVTIHDPPFVYTYPVHKLSECEYLRKVPVTLAERDHLLISGPWYPCPKNTGNTTLNFCCAGYAIDLLSNMSLPEEGNSIDTSFSFSLHLNESYGSVTLPSEAGSGYQLSGSIGELTSDMADMAIGGLTINPERERYIDFTEPWLYHGIKIMEKTIPKDSPMESFLQPLKGSLWTSLLVSVILIGCVIFILDLKSPFDRFYKVDKSQLDPDDPFLERSPDDRVDFGEAMWFVWGVLLNSGVSEKTPRSCSARVMGIVWCGFCMIMVASYTANLAAFLVLDQPEKGLSGITDPRLRNPSANFSFATVLNSNVYQYFKRHVELSTMFRKMETHNVHLVSDAIQSLINGSLDAFIWDSTRLEFEASRKCELRTRGALFGRSAYGVGLQKHSPWTHHITAAILRMTESGQIEALDSKWISLPTQCVTEVHKSPARLGLMNMKDVFILVSGGVAAGALFSFIEVTYGRRRAAMGRREELARRYTEKWLLHVRCSRKMHKYNVDRPVLRRGFAGIEAIGLEDCRRRLLSRTHRVLPVDVDVSSTFRPDLNFGTMPVILFCSRCRHLVETDVRSSAGCFSVSCCLILSLLFLWPCAPLPCFLNLFADFTHYCPFCAHKIGKYRRARKNKFYV